MRSMLYYMQTKHLSAMLKLETELAKIRGIGPKFLTKLEKLKILTVKDLLWHFPFRYEDFSTVVKIADLKINQAATVRGVVKKVAMRRSWRRGIAIIEALVADETGGIKAIWFNQPYIAKFLQLGRRVNFAGKVVYSNDELYLQSPSYELIGETTQTKHTAGLIPIYSETRGLTSKGLRFLTASAFKNLEPVKDFIPKEILEETEYPDLITALKNIHFPKVLAQAEQARQRFAFADLFLLQLTNLKNRLRLAQEKAASLKVDEVWLKDVIAKLPFTLTAAQERSLKEILEDLGKNQPMNRLLQGDVGSGKTVVAAVAALAAAQNGKQTAFMAPTEVLARQHYKTLSVIFKSFPVGIALMTGGESRAYYGDGLEEKVSRAKLAKEISEGRIKVTIGTHALISSGKTKKQTDFQDLALAIVDEQHRFGVEQRAALLKSGKSKETTVHFLSMSATPIPRTLALGLFGDLDLSIIDELPVGRKEIITKIIPPENREKAYNFIREQIKSGRQAFVICPRIEAAVSTEGASSETATTEQKPTPKQLAWSEVRAVKEEFERLSQKIFPDLKVAMIHGKLKSSEKAQLMSDFASGKVNILVSTSVIEVGVDVPNTTIMMIEGADRFGLAQLYQFRGRVGRGEHQSYCLLFTDSTAETTKDRLNALLKAKNGFELAEQDLAIRGPGEFIGDKQTGIPDLAMRALNNLEIVKSARASATAILKKDKELSAYPILRAELEKFKRQVHLE